ncbi:MAG: hypothetical protein C4K60_08210 [Ideonella sp. MAG2]|nr:MAG: hypothetical protein C4K60_08210 [Ideonella sp. MAG2]
MKSTKHSLIAVALMALSVAAAAKNVPTYVPWDSVVSDLKQEGTLQGIELRFGSASAQGLTIKSSTTLQHKEIPFPEPTRQAPSDEALCQKALKQVLIRAVEQARREGANAVVGVVSQVAQHRLDSPANAQCRSGLSGAVAGVSIQFAVLP